MSDSHFDERIPLSARHSPDLRDRDHIQNGEDESALYNQWNARNTSSNISKQASNIHEIKELERELLSKNSELRKLERGIEKYQAKVLDLEHGNTSLESEYREYRQMHMHEKSRSENHISELLKKLDECMSKHNADVDRMKQREIEALNRTNELQGKLDESLVTIEELRSSLKEIQEDNHNLKGELETVPSKLQSRCSALEKQLANIPSSLVVANAELRVLEAKMIEHEEACCKREEAAQFNASKMHRELEAFMRKHTMEKHKLMQRVSEQAQTIHRLTHHVHLLQSIHDPEKVVPVPENITDDEKFGGPHPLFYKGIPIDDVVKGPNGFSPNHSTRNIFVEKPWPLSDQLFSDLPVGDPAQEKSFVGRIVGNDSNSSSTSEKNELFGVDYTHMHPRSVSSFREDIGITSNSRDAGSPRNFIDDKTPEVSYQEETGHIGSRTKPQWSNKAYTSEMRPRYGDEYIDYRNQAHDYASVCHYAETSDNNVNRFEHAERYRFLRNIYINVVSFHSRQLLENQLRLHKLQESMRKKS